MNQSDAVVDQPSCFANLYRDGYGIKAIAKMAGSAPSTVRGILRRSGVTMRTAEESKRVSLAYANRYETPQRAKRREEEAGKRERREKELVEARERRRLATNDERRRKYRDSPQHMERDKWRARLAKAIVRGQDSAAKRFGVNRAEDLRLYIQMQWKPGMSWENYGRGGGMDRWHVDHIFPVSRYDLTHQGQASMCWHYTNLQPMWANENIRKSNQVVAQMEANLGPPGA